MSNSIFTNPNWSSLTGPLVELQKINQKASEEIIKECMSFFSDNAGSTLKYAQALPHKNNPEDFFNDQLKLLVQQGEKVLVYTKNVFEIYQKSFKEQLELAQSQLNNAPKTVSTKTNKSDEPT